MIRSNSKMEFGPVSASTLPLKALLLGLGLAMSLAGCGAKGPLEPPPSAAEQPKSEVKADEGMGDIPTIGQAKKKSAKPTETPKQPFFLDFLL